MIYDYYKEKSKRTSNMKFFIGLILLVLFSIISIGVGIYLDLIQLDEMGGFSEILLINLKFKIIFGIAVFLIVSIVFYVTNLFISKNLNRQSLDRNLLSSNKNKILIPLIAGVIGAIITKDTFYIEALKFINTQEFNILSPLLEKDISYFIFERPFLLILYNFIYSLSIFILVYTLIVYLASIASNIQFVENKKGFNFDFLKVKPIFRHNFVNLALLFIIKALSYKFQKEGLMYSNVEGLTGAGYVEVNVWLKYFTIAPVLLIAIVLIAIIYAWRNNHKRVIQTVLLFPAVWIGVVIVAVLMQKFYVKPNLIKYEAPYVSNNISSTRQAYNLESIKVRDFPSMGELTYDIMNNNEQTKKNIRIIDYKSALSSNRELQSNTNFYTFRDGDIINYELDGIKTPVFITAREMNKDLLPRKDYPFPLFNYTHGYGVVINPINKINKQGQVEFIIGSLKESKEKIMEPRIYFGELTNDHVIVNANGLNEIDYDGNTGEETRYNGKGGIQLNFINKLLFAMKYNDINILISGYVNADSRILVNRNILDRASKALPFLMMDTDPYIVVTDDGRLKWIVDGYTVSDEYPYSQEIYKNSNGKYHKLNYIRNSVKVFIDAYDGKVEAYIIDNKDPLAKVYKNIYKGIFKEGDIPKFAKDYMKYPEMLFDIQSNMLKNYHFSPSNSDQFMSGQGRWKIAQHFTDERGAEVRDIESFYNMIKLPEQQSKEEELILMRPYSPSGTSKNNMVSWLYVRNEFENYGEMMLYRFPSNTNIFGPYQVATKINQIDEISKSLNLWSGSSSDVYKGNLMVIPIENSVLYVEPIYVKAKSDQTIPEIKKVVVVTQKKEELFYGIGNNLDDALDDLFKNDKSTSVNEISKDDIDKIDKEIYEDNQEQLDLDNKNQLDLDINDESNFKNKLKEELEKAKRELNDINSTLENIDKLLQKIQ